MPVVNRIERAAVGGQSKWRNRPKDGGELSAQRMTAQGCKALLAGKNAKKTNFS